MHSIEETNIHLSMIRIYEGYSVWARRTSRTPLLFIEVPVPWQNIELLFLCLMSINFASILRFFD